MGHPPTRHGSRRRNLLRQTFDRRVDREWKRYSGEPKRVLRRVLRERFVRKHIRNSRGVILELGSGPGRFTPILRGRSGVRVVAVDLSRESLRSGRRHAPRMASRSSIDWVQAAGECLPLVSGSVDVAVVLGNIVSFAATDGAVLLDELNRVVRRRGLLVVDFASPAGAMQEFFQVASERRLLPRVLRRPRYFFVDRILDTGFQPYAPNRLASWDFQFYTMEEAVQALRHAGFGVIDAMCVAPIAAHQNRVAAIAFREKRTWESLLRIEERVGRRPGAFEVGHGFVLAAIRK